MQRDHRYLARLLAYGRVAVGASLVLAPRRAGAMWVRPAVARDATALARALGARDVALGVGIVAALDAGAPAAGWVRASSLCDVVDAVATVLATPRIGLTRAVAVTAVATAAALAGLAVAEGVDADRTDLLGVDQYAP